MMRLKDRLLGCARRIERCRRDQRGVISIDELGRTMAGTGGDDAE